MVFGEIDTADILTHTRLPQTLKLWYHLLNCGFRLPATAGTDRIGPEEPVGHQRVYVKLEEPLTYPGWMEGLRQGRSFVTNGPMVSLSVNGRGPGETVTLSNPKVLRIQARGRSLRPFERLGDRGQREGGGQRSGSRPGPPRRPQARLPGRPEPVDCRSLHGGNPRRDLYLDPPPVCPHQPRPYRLPWTGSGRGRERVLSARLPEAVGAVGPGGSLLRESATAGTRPWPPSVRA